MAAALLPHALAKLAAPARGPQASAAHGASGTAVSSCLPEGLPCLRQEPPRDHWLPCPGTEGAGKGQVQHMIHVSRQHLLALGARRGRWPESGQEMVVYIYFSPTLFIGNVQM